MKHMEKQSNRTAAGTQTVRAAHACVPGVAGDAAPESAPAGPHHAAPVSLGLRAPGPMRTVRSAAADRAEVGRQAEGRVPTNAVRPSAAAVHTEAVPPTSPPVVSRPIVPPGVSGFGVLPVASVAVASGTNAPSFASMALASESVALVPAVSLPAALTAGAVSVVPSVVSGPTVWRDTSDAAELSRKGVVDAVEVLRTVEAVEQAEPVYPEKTANPEEAGTPQKVVFPSVVANRAYAAKPDETVKFGRTADAGKKAKPEEAAHPGAIVNPANTMNPARTAERRATVGQTASAKRPEQPDSTAADVQRPQTAGASPGPELSDIALGPMSRDRAEAARFFDRYERSLLCSATNRAAYEQTERDYAARTGHRRFRTYGSFRSAYSQYCSRLQRNRAPKARAALKRCERHVAHLAAAFAHDVDAHKRGC